MANEISIKSRNELILENILGADNVLPAPVSLTETLLTCWLNGDNYTDEIYNPSRNTSALLAIVNGTTYDAAPTCEIEALLAAIANGTDPDPIYLPPKSRIGALLYDILKNNIPKEYHEVEWIRADKASWIDTGVVPVLNKTRIIFDGFETIDRSLFGSTANFFGMTGVSTSNNIRFTYNLATYMSSFDRSDRHKWELNKRQCFVDGENIYNFAASSNQDSLSIVLFARHTTTSTNDRSDATCFGCQIYDDEKLIRDFVPCYRKADGEVGLYDKKTRSFFENEGTGTFTKGPDVN